MTHREEDQSTASDLARLSVWNRIPDLGFTPAPTHFRASMGQEAINDLDESFSYDEPDAILSADSVSSFEQGVAGEIKGSEEIDGPSLYKEESDVENGFMKDGDSLMHWQNVGDGLLASEEGPNWDPSFGEVPLLQAPIPPSGGCVMRSIGQRELLLRLKTEDLLLLEELTLDRIDYPDYRYQVMSCVNVKILGITHSSMEPYLQEIFQLVNVNTLFLSSCSLWSIPDEIGLLVHLERLFLPYNSLSDLPNGMSRLSRLSLLNIARNSFHQFPDVLCLVTSLTHLAFPENNVSSLPMGMSNLVNLRYLYCNNNRSLDNVWSSISSLPTLTEVDVSECSVSSLPESLTSFVSLQSISLNGSDLSVLPCSIADLDSLTCLDLTNAGDLGILPRQICDLQCLKELRLSSNHLSSLPEALGLLDNLVLLVASHNEIQKLPCSVGKLRQLKQLDLSNNQIRYLPDTVGYLTALTELDVSRNQLMTLPYSLGSISSLSDISVSRNPLPMMPFSVRSSADVLRYLQSVARSGAGRCHSVKLVIVGSALAGKSSVLKCMQEGQGDCRVHHDQRTHGIDVVELPISSWSVSDSSISTVDAVLSCWDFAGDEVYRSVHSLFLSNRSIYLLCWDVHKGAELKDLRFWLNSIKTFSSNSAILLVGTHYDSLFGDICTRDRLDNLASTAGFSSFDNFVRKCPTLKDISTFPIMWEGLGLSSIDAIIREGGPQIRGAMLMSCANGQGVMKLRGAVSTCIKDLWTVEEVVPLSWLKLRQSVKYARRILPSVNYLPIGKNADDFVCLVNREGSTEVSVGESPPFVSWDIFRDVIARECHYSDDKDLLRGIQFLHSLGDLLYFPESSELGSIVFLDPQWLVNVLREVVFPSSGFRATDGVVAPNNWSKIWSEQLIASEVFPSLLRLLFRFKIAYPVRDLESDRLVPLEKVRWVVPCLLPDVTPEGVWREWGTLSSERKEFKIVYSLSFLVPALFPSLLWSFRAFSDAALSWRHGALLKEKLSSASLGQKLLILSDPSTAQLTISVRGPHPLYLFSKVAQSLHSLLRSEYSSIKYGAYIPCPFCFMLSVKIEDFFSCVLSGTSCVSCNNHLCSEKFIPLSAIVDSDSLASPLVIDHCARVFGVRSQLPLSSPDFCNGLDPTCSGASMRQRREIIQSSFLFSYRAELFQSPRDGSDLVAPLVFAVTSTILWASSPVTSLSRAEYKLHLMCEKPGCWHPIGVEIPLMDPVGFFRVVGSYIQESGLHEVLWATRVGSTDYSNSLFGNFKEVFEQSMLEKRANKRSATLMELSPSQATQEIIGHVLREAGLPIIRKGGKRQIGVGSGRLHFTTLRSTLLSCWVCPDCDEEQIDMPGSM